MRTPFIAGNWKMNMLIPEAVELAEDLKSHLKDIGDVQFALCPPFTALSAVGQALRNSPIMLGGQNCYCEESGAFTGEVSPQMLMNAGCEWTIIGHSERRQHFGESDELLNKKVHFARESGLNVMFCIGETLEEREANQTEDVLRRHTLEGLKGLDAAAFKGVVVAYEPVWAIGTGKTATPDQAEEAHSFVRELIREEFGGTVADALRIQYGGSVKPDNAAELLSQPNVDGALVGGASLKADSFTEIVRAAAG